MVMVGHNQIRDNPSCWGDTNTLPDPHLLSSWWLLWICGQYRNFYIYSTSPQVEFVCDCTMHVIKYLYIYPEAQWS